MGTCLFTSFALGAPEYASLLNAATGTNYTPEELLEVGDRIFNIERMFNKAAGMKPEDDRLPKRLLKRPLQGYGQQAGRHPAAVLRGPRLGQRLPDRRDPQKAGP